MLRQDSYAQTPKPEPLGAKARHVNSEKNQKTKNKLQEILKYKPGYLFTEHLDIEGPVCAGCCPGPGGTVLSDVAPSSWSGHARGGTDDKPASM